MSIKPILASHSDLVLGRDGSKLNATINSGTGTLSVYSISKFDTNQIILVGSIGSESSEILKTHASTDPSGNTITLASNTTKDHVKDSQVLIIPYDQIEFSHAASIGASKTVLTTVAIDVERNENLYEDTAHIEGYYYVRYKNSISGDFSDYSDPIPFDGFEENTVGYAIDRAMTDLGAEFSDKLTFDMLVNAAQDMLRLVRGKLKKWAKYQKYDTNIGTVSAGVRKFAMPSDIYDKNSNRSILNLRIGNDTPLTFIDRSEYIQATEGVFYTEIATEASTADTSLELDDTSNLDDSGSISVFVSGTKYTIDFTANDKSTNTLTVASDQITATLPVNSPVWFNINESGPQYYSVWDGYLYLWPMITASQEGRTLLMDYCTDIETIRSQSDVIQGTKFDMLIPYLKFRIRTILENSGKEDLKDPSFLQFRELMEDAITNDRSEEINSFRPRHRAIYGGRKHNSRR